MKEFIYYYRLDFGDIAIIERDLHISKLCLAEKVESNQIELKETPLIKKCHKQLLEFLGGFRKEFDLPIKPEGSSFQKKVWKSLLKIPYGEKRSYKEIAEDIQNPGAYRAVGNANGKNPILIIIPCHRVIAADGGLGGYSSGIKLKKSLLDLEEGNIKTTKI